MPVEKTVFIICGPTAVGKTDYAIDKALQYHTQILSADSRQCFRELNIGVSKPDSSQLAKVHHYFINSHSIFDEIDAAGYERYGLASLQTIFLQHDIAVVTGGTGLYVKALTEGLDDIPEPNKETVIQIQNKWKELGMPWLTSTLQEADPAFAKKGEMKNPHRMLRALAIKLSTGKSIVDFHTAGKKARPFAMKKILLEMDRNRLYDRINRRVDLMIKEGLIEEARTLYPHKMLNALQTVGYRELFDYFENRISKDQAIELIKLNTRHYAKRQITWFNKYFRDQDTQVVTL